MNKLDRYLKLANPFARIGASINPKIFDAAPNSGGLRLSSDKQLNFSLWNTLGVASWAVPLAVIATTLVNAKAKREVDRARDKSEEQLLESSRPVITPTSLKEKAPKRNSKSIAEIENDVNTIEKKAGMLDSSVQMTLPLLALPASYWLASKLTNKFISDKISNDLEEERQTLRKLQDAEDLERLKLLGMIKEEDGAGELSKTASDEEGWLSKVKSFFSGTDPVATGKLLLWDGHLVPALAASAMLAIGGGMYLSNRDRDTKKVKLLTKKLLGENRLYDPPALSIDLKGATESDQKNNQMHQIEGIPSSAEVSRYNALENSKEKDALF